MYAVRRYGYQPEEPQWQDHRRLTGEQLPRAIRPWLLDTGSLTARLVRASGGEFRVVVLEQRWLRPRKSERNLLNLDDRCAALIREVLLVCRGEPWVFARSVLPAHTLEGRLRHLRKLNDSALGAMLFSDPSMERAPYEVARLHGTDKSLPECVQTDADLWGRRSCFYLSGLPLMVSEIFLPAFRP